MQVKLFQCAYTLQQFGRDINDLAGGKDGQKTLVVAPGMPITFKVREFRRDNETASARVCEKLILKPGEVRDLGTAKLKFENE